MDELKSKIEAVLFCCSNGISARKLASLCGIGSAGHVKAMLQSLAEDYNARGAGLEIVETDKLWRMRIAPTHSDLVRESAKPDMDTSVLETLAYIAWKGSIRQSELVKARSNKAYDHISELLKQGFIEKVKRGSTFTVKPSKKFYEYFDVKEGEKLDSEHVFADSGNE